MQEATLLRIAIVCTFMGIAALLILSLHMKLPEQPILENDESYLIQGEITRITQKESVSYIDLHKGDDLTVVLFK